MAGLPADTFYALGKSEDGSYLVVLVPPTIVPGGLGWVKTDLVEPRNIDNIPVFKAPPAPGSSRYLQPEPGQPFASPFTYINIRGGPGEDYTVYTTAERGSIYIITAVTPDGVWYKIKVPKGISSDEVAWIAAPNTRAFNSGSIQAVVYPMPMPNPRSDALEPLCQVVSQKPLIYEVYNEGVTFTVEFVIRNNTGATWSRGDIDFVYIENFDNALLHTGPDRIDLEKHVAAGDSATVKFEAKSPSGHDGVNYGERWVVRKGGLNVCTFEYQIRTFTPTKTP
jgi:hypothetical protein